MKILLPFLFALLFSNSYSQEFTYKKVFMDGMSAKLNGDISISDSILKISMNGKAKDYPVDIILKKEDFVQYKLKTGTSETQIRFTFQANQFNNKTEKYTLNMEIKDEFTNKLTTMIYFLIPITR
jgi:hypothetical protein